eukprot:m.133899 g.133899  ORF g.133899 m.133899 type:complete len:56 (-) comp23844_c0_seq11:128-295(-)
MAVETCLKFADTHHMLVEPACGAALSPLIPKVAIVCGGAAADFEHMTMWKEKVGL